MKTRYLILLLLLVLAAQINALDPWGEPIVLSQSMTLMAEVSINNTPAEAGDVLAAFVEVDGIMQLRGKATIQVIDGNSACLLQIYTEVDNEMLIFRIWDDSANAQIGVPAQLPSVVNGIIGQYPDQLYPVNGDGSFLIADPWGQPLVLPSSMSVMATVYINDIPAAANDVLAAFVMVDGTEHLRGKALVQVVDGEPGCLIQIFGENAGEQILFKAWNHDEQQIESSGNALSFEPEAWLGSYPDAMYFINAGGAIQQISMPQFTPASGTYPPSTPINIECPEAGVSIHYTTDGSTPTESSLLFTEAIYLPMSANTSIRARAFGDGWHPSMVSSSTYQTTYQAANPVFNPPAGGYEEAILVQISCATTSAQIRYTLDGSEPTQYSALYSNPIVLADSTVVKARAFYPNWDPSEIVAAEYVFTVSTPGSAQSPAYTGIRSAYPNPFKDQLSIAVDIKGAQQSYRLQVFNLRGECVHSFSGMAKGSFELEWNGKDQSGRKLPTGVYLLKLSTKETQNTRKVILHK